MGDIRQYLDLILVALNCVLTCKLIIHNNRSMREDGNRRQLSSKRLYNLLRVVVIGLTIIAVVYAALLYRIYFTYPGWYSNEVSGCQQRYPDHAHMFNFNHTTNDIESKFYDNCLSIASDIQKKGEDQFNKAVDVAILLPLLFFGGTLVYRYLFPRKA
jgi:hypothetical protein